MMNINKDLLIEDLDDEKPGVNLHLQENRFKKHRPLENNLIQEETGSGNGKKRDKGPNDKISTQQSCDQILADAPTAGKQSGEQKEPITKLTQLAKLLQKAWKWHKWISAQPEFGKSKNNIQSLVMYLLFFGLACFPVYDVFRFNNTYTDAQIQYVMDHPITLPHGIICPPKVEKFEHDVWWNTKLIKNFSMSKSHMNLLAEMARKLAFGIRVNDRENRLANVTQKYLAKIKFMARNGNTTMFRELHKTNLTQNMSNTAISLKLIWNFLVKAPQGADYMLQKFTYPYYLVYRDAKILYSEYLSPKFSWIDNAYCLVYEKTEHTRINSTFMMAKMIFPHESRYWIGNLTTDLVNITSLYVAYKTIWAVRHDIETVILRDKTSSLQKKKTCQTQMSMYASKCEDVNVEEEVMHVVHAGFQNLGILKNRHGSSQVSFHFEKPLWYIAKEQVYSWVAIAEITTGVFCLFLGVSFFQILSLVALLLKTTCKITKKIPLEPTFAMLSLIPTIILLIYDINNLFAPSLVEKIAIGNSLPIPSISITASLGMNFTKIQELNISFELLNYIYIASSMGAMNINHGIAWKSSTWNFLKHPNETSCEAEMTNLDNEYKYLAHKMGLSSTDPAFVLLEQLYIDKCQYIINCGFSGWKLDNCCHYFSFNILNAKMKPGFVLNNPNRSFTISKSVAPDIKIDINMSVLSQGYPAYEKLIRGSVTLIDKDRNLRKFNSSSLRQSVSFGFMGDHYFIPYHNYGYDAMIVKRGFVSQLNFVHSITKALQKENEKQGLCTYDTTCAGSEISALAISAKNIYIKKHCGCFICFNGINPIVKFNECCSPIQAVHCIANPLLYVKNYKKYQCRKSEMLCSSSSVIKFNCSASTENPLLLSRFGTGIRPSRWGRQRDPPRYPELEPFTLAEMRRALNEAGCDYNLGLSPCKRREYKFSNFQWFKFEKELGRVELVMDRSSILNNYQVSRTDRRFSALEAFGIFLGGIGLFLGVDILCLIESLINYWIYKKSSNMKRFQTALAPVKAHLLRMFHSIEKKKKTSKVHTEMSERSKSDKLEEQEVQISVKIQLIKNSLFGISAAILLITGITISIYVGSSTLLSFNEWNLDVHKNNLPEEHPSFAICKFADPRSESWENVPDNFLNSTRCWIEMNQKPCQSLFTIILNFGVHRCYIANGSSEDFRVLKTDIQYNDFAFAIAIPNGYVVRVPIWFGNLQNVLSGSFTFLDTLSLASNGLLGEATTHITIYHYQELRNMSCRNLEICPPCLFKQKNQSCCIISPRIEQEDLTCKKMFKSVNSNHRLTEKKLAAMFQTIDPSEIKKYVFLGFKRSSQFVFEFNEIPRHSSGAKFSIIAGYIDLLLGLSVVSFAGTGILRLWEKAKQMIARGYGNIIYRAE